MSDDQELPPPPVRPGPPSMNVPALLADLLARVEQLEKDRAVRWNPRRNQEDS